MSRMMSGILMAGLCVALSARVEAQGGPGAGKPLAAKVDDLSKAVESLRGDLDSLQSSFDGIVLQGHVKRIGEIKAEIENIKKEIAAIKSAKPPAVETGKPTAQPPETEAALDARLRKVEDRIPAIASEIEALKHQPVEVKTEVRKDPVRPLFSPAFEFRLRGEYQRDRLDFNGDADDEDLFYVQRLRLGMNVQPTSWLRGTAIVQDSRTWGEEKDLQANQKNLDLHEGYVLLSDRPIQGLSIKLGRMELNYGSEFQLGRANWSNVGRSFDGLLLSYAARPLNGPADDGEYMRVDAFATRVREGQDSVAGGHDESFHGIYATSSYLWFLRPLDVYAFYLHRNDREVAKSDPATGATTYKTRDEDVITAGGRAVVRPFRMKALAGLSIEGEAAVQFGNRYGWDKDNARNLKLSHFAAMYFAQILYEAPVWGAPTAGAFYYWTSGDANDKDDRSNAYRPLFPTKHKVLGNMDLFTLQGVWDVGGTLRLRPHETVNLKLDYHRFFLSADGGSIEAFDGTAAFPGGKGKYIGQEMDFTVKWVVWKYISLDAGYSVFMPSSSVKGVEVTRKNASDAEYKTTLGKDISHWVFFMTTASF